MANVTRASLRDAVHRETGLPLREAAAMVDAVIETVAARLAAGETVKLSGFGTFSVRAKRGAGRTQPQDRRGGADIAAPGGQVPAVGGAEGEGGATPVGRVRTRERRVIVEPAAP